MANDTKLKDLSITGSVTGANIIPISQSSQTKGSTLTTLLTWITGNFGILTVGTWNSRIKKRVIDVPSGINIGVDCDDYDVVTVQNLGTNTTIDNPTGTPYDGQELEYWIEDNLTSRNLTFDTDFHFSSDLAAPAATTLGRKLYLRFIWLEIESKWMCVQKLDNF